MTTPNNHTKHLVGLARRGMTHWLARRARTAMTLATLLAIVALAGGPPGITRAQSAGQTVNGTLTIVNNGPGDQTDPHISGALVAYISGVSGNSEIRYHNLLTGADASIPNNGGWDFLPDISGPTIVYAHGAADGSSSIYMFDTDTAGPPVELDPQPGSLRTEPAIGNRTVAWVDYGFFASTPWLYPEIVVYDLTTQTATRLTDDLLYDIEPAVSPDGSVIVWTSCQGFYSGCDIRQATRSGSGWTTTQLTGAAGEEHDPDTNGQVVIYDSVRAGDEDIYWQPVGGGAEQRLALPSQQRNPNLSGNLVALESFDDTVSPPTWEILLYDLATSRLYRLTATPEDETLDDISVTPDGQVRVVWTMQEADANIYALTFRLPASDTTPPTITISAPTNTIYTLNQAVAASYSCADESGGSGLASCVGTVASGSLIDTASVGAKTFTVNAADNAGNTASRSVSYTVAYNLCVLYDQSKAHKLGSTVPIKLQLCDASGANASAASIVVHATGLTQQDSTASSVLDDSSAANPDNDFRYDATLGGSGGYIYNLSTRNLSTGTWVLSFTAAGDPTTHTVQFDVR